MIVRIAVMSALLVLLGPFGCGGDSGGGGGTHLTWQVDGTSVTALGGRASWSSTAGRDSIAITGFASSGEDISIGISNDAPLMPQTFDCAQPTGNQSVSVSSAADAGVFAAQSCTVTLSQVGAVGGTPTIGTFAATLTSAASGNKAITNGSFNLPLM